MAEAAFGVAAGIVGVASLVVQLVDSANKLRELYESYGGANEEVKSLIDELEQLERLIQQLSASAPIPQPPVGNPSVLEDCKTWCRSVKTRIQEVLHEIGLKIEQNPRKGRLHYVFKRSTIQQWMQTLYRAKLDLLLAVHIVQGQEHASAFSTLQRDVVLLQSDQKILLDRASGAATNQAQIGKDLWDVYDRLRKLDTSLQDVKDAIARLPVHMSAFSRRLLEVEELGHAMLTQQDILRQRLESGVLVTKLEAVQRSLLDSQSSTNAIKRQLDPLNATPSAASLSLPASEEYQKIEVQFALFKYTYERKGLSTATGERHQPTSAAHGEIARFRVKLPLWFIKEQWAVSILKATAGWQYSLRLYRVMHNDTEIFELCMAGNVEAVRARILAGDVSIYDQNEQGHTLLHVAAFAHQAALSRLLIDMGAQSHALSNIRVGYNDFFAEWFLTV